MNTDTEGLCTQTDPELWFPKHGDHLSPKLATQICQRCPVRKACLKAALAGGEQYGIWGGVNLRPGGDRTGTNQQRLRAALEAIEQREAAA